MNKLRLVFIFTIIALIVGAVFGAVFGGLTFYSPSRSSVMLGVVNGSFYGVITGILNGLMLGAVTAQFFYPLRQRKGYRMRMILFALAFSALGLLSFMLITSRQPNSDARLVATSYLLFIVIPIAPFIGFAVATYHLRTQPLIDNSAV